MGPAQSLRQACVVLQSFYEPPDFSDRLADGLPLFPREQLRKVLFAFLYGACSIVQDLGAPGRGKGRPGSKSGVITIRRAVKG